MIKSCNFIVTKKLSKDTEAIMIKSLVLCVFSREVTHYINTRMAFKMAISHAQDDLRSRTTTRKCVHRAKTGDKE